MHFAFKQLMWKVIEVMEHFEKGMMGMYAEWSKANKFFLDLKSLKAKED